MARMPCSHFFCCFVGALETSAPPCVCCCFVGALETSAPPLYALFALLVHLRQVHPLCVRCCFVGALLALASGKAERRQVHPLKHRSPSDRIPSAVRSDSVRRPIGLTTILHNYFKSAYYLCEMGNIRA